MPAPPAQPASSSGSLPPVLTRYADDASDPSRGVVVNAANPELSNPDNEVLFSPYADSFSSIETRSRPQLPSPSSRTRVPDAARRRLARPPKRNGSSSSSPGSILAAVFAAVRALWITFVRPRPWQQFAMAVVGVVVAVLGVLALVYGHRALEALEPAAGWWRGLPPPTGQMLIIAIIAVTAIPPVVGYSTAVTAAGFLYGFPWAWPLVALANVAGSVLAFWLARWGFSRKVLELVGRDRRFVALGHVLSARGGLAMLAAIRFCPLPYSISNGALAQVPSITPLQFALATAISR